MTQGAQPLESPVLSGPRLYNLEEAGAQLGGVGRSLLNEEINCGRLRAVRLGKGWKIPADWLQEYIDRLKEERPARPIRAAPPTKGRGIIPPS